MPASRDTSVASRRLHRAPVTPPPLPSPRLSSQGGRLDAVHGRAQHAVGLPSIPVTPDRRHRSSQSERQRPVRARTDVADVLPSAGAKHSHELSWSSTTRESLVDNLLFSLDSLSRGNADYDPEPPPPPRPEVDWASYPFRPPFALLPTSQDTHRYRSHTYSSSTSSAGPLPSGMDARAVRRGGGGGGFGDDHDDEKVQRAKSDAKSTNTALPSKPLSATSQMEDQARLSSDTCKPGKVEPQQSQDAIQGRSGDGSETDRSRPAWKRRSVSLDGLYARHNVNAQSILARGRPVPSMHSAYDAYYNAAPEPNIANGPRSQHNPNANGPVFIQNPPQRLTIRKITTQSDLRASLQALPSPSIPVDVRNQASSFVRASSIRASPLSPGLPNAQSSPLLNSMLHTTTTTTTTTTPGHQTTSAATPRDRPGFFRRVFRGGAARVVSDPANCADSMENRQPIAAPARPSGGADGESRREARQLFNKERQDSAHHCPPPPPPPPPLPLNKKPSSFFRRRKKSTSEPMPQPLHLNDRLDVAAQKAQLSPSSASSLRQVMDQYLDVPAGDNVDSNAAARPATKESSSPDSDDLDIFHSGYNPPADASLAGDRDASALSPTRRTGRSVDGGGGSSDSNSNSSPKMKIKTKKARPTLSGLVVESAVCASPTAISPVTKVRRPGDQENDPSGGDSDKPAPESSLADGNRSAPDSTGTPKWQGSMMSTEQLSLPLQGAGDERLRHGSLQLSVVSEAESGVTSWGSTMLETTTNTGTFASGAHSPVTPSTHYHSATSLPLPNGQADGVAPPKLAVSDTARRSRELTAEGAEYIERARKIFDGNEEDVSKMEAAAWLGETNTLSTRTRREYMALFDFAGVNILASLRILCAKLILRGETQQFDRIITALAERWCECNPNHGFAAQDVVHTILYSLILLNTDLHLADISEKMSRSAYVKNTLPTIRRVVADAAPNAFDGTVRVSTPLLRPVLPWTDTSHHSPSGTGEVAPPSPTERGRSEFPRAGAAKCTSARPTACRADSDGNDIGASEAANALINQAPNCGMKNWELEIEGILKAFYLSIKSDPLPLYRSASHNSLSVERSQSPANGAGTGTLKRSGSIVSKTASEATSHRLKPGLRAMTMGFQGRYGRSRPKFYPPSTLGSSSRTSFDDGNSIWSPAHSNFSSKYSSARTLTSSSMASLGSHYTSAAAADFKHSIGFASALSQAIVREEAAGNRDGGAETDSISISVPVGLLEDDALALEGAPWAKEGLVKHKHYLEVEGKRAKERSWSECFAVISSGKLTLFAFNTSSKGQSLGRKALSSRTPTSGPRVPSIAAPRVGGGDWMENAEQLDVFVLRQTIASTLPPPGYSKARPHVWALSLPSGAVHLFQVGTPEIAQEFMSTANYWSARLSKEPLTGSVSNIEYGWSEDVISPAILERVAAAANLADNGNSSAAARVASPTPPITSSANILNPRSPQLPPVSIQNRAIGHMHSNSAGSGRPSLQSSVRTSFDTGFGSASRARTPGDKISIADWHPPSQSMMPSQLMEVDQLKALTAYVTLQEAELEKHNEMKAAIELAYTPRLTNHARALANWQRRSDYILREIVKFRTYIDSLTAAQLAKDAFYKRKMESEKSTDATVAAPAPASGAAPATSTAAGVAIDTTPATTAA